VEFWRTTIPKVRAVPFVRVFRLSRDLVMVLVDGLVQKNIAHEEQPPLRVAVASLQFSVLSHQECRPDANLRMSANCRLEFRRRRLPISHPIDANFPAFPGILPSFDLSFFTSGLCGQILAAIRNHHSSKHH
jgi:hypothetical protein